MFSFNIDFDDIGKKIIPIRKRKTRFLDFLHVILNQIALINQQLIALRDKVDYKLSHNAQIIYLEHWLNDKYDSVQRRIYIADTANIEYTYFFNRIENRPVYLYNRSEMQTVFYLLNRTELISPIGYIVMVPTDIPFNSIEMRNDILVYNMAGIQFTIQTF
jgi:hypothetical protein